MKLEFIAGSGEAVSTSTVLDGATPSEVVRYFTAETAQLEVSELIKRAWRSTSLAEYYNREFNTYEFRLALELGGELTQIVTRYSGEAVRHLGGRQVSEGLVDMFAYKVYKAVIDRCTLDKF